MCKGPPLSPLYVDAGMISSEAAADDLHGMGMTGVWNGGGQEIAHRRIFLPEKSENFRKQVRKHEEKFHQTGTETGQRMAQDIAAFV